MGDLKARGEVAANYGVNRLPRCLRRGKCLITK